MKIDKTHHILKEQQERRLQQTIYTWGNQKTSRKRVTYKSCDLEGPKPFPHISSPEGRRKTEWGRGRGVGRLNTQPWRPALGA